MSHPFDATLKDILSKSAADLAPVLHLPVNVPSRSLNVDLSTISAATDVAFGFGEPLQEIVDINLQSGPDARVDTRMLLYSAAYHHHYPVPVRSVLILLRQSADLARLTGTLAYHASDSKVEFVYEVIRMWQQPLDLFLKGGLALLPLAPLCQLRADVPVDEALREVIHQVDLRLANEAPYAVALKLMTATFVLTGLRIPRQNLDGVFRGVKVMHDSSAFELYEEKGRQEGELAGRVSECQRSILVFGRKPFGEPDRNTEAAVRAIRDIDRLERLVDAANVAKSWQELLAIP